MYRANWAKGPSARLAWATARCTTRNRKRIRSFTAVPQMQQRQRHRRDWRRGHELTLAAMRATQALVLVDAAHEGLDRQEGEQPSPG